MPIPALDGHGLLPVGTHDCTWEEVRAGFCWNAHRTLILDRAMDFLDQRWRPLGLAVPIFVDGSFTRTKDLPEDVDLVVDASTVHQDIIAPVVTLWLQRAALKTAYSVDFWVKHPLWPNDLTEFFCYTGLKAGAELGLDAKHVKGILRVQP